MTDDVAGAPDGARAPGDEPVEVDAEPVPETEYTIDEVARMTGVPSRTIRFYQSKGTLPAPRRQGRVALYTDDHVERLKLIGELQNRGLRLDAIRDAMHQLEGGTDSLQSWLGVGDRLQAPWIDERPLVLGRDELLARFEQARPGLLQDLEQAGVIRREGNSQPAMYLVPSPGLLDIGVRLEASGIDVDTAMGAAEIIRKHVRRTADELVTFFADRAGKGFGRGSGPEDLVAAYEGVRPIGNDALRIIFAQEIERALREFVESGRAVVAGGRAKRREDEVRRERERDGRDSRDSRHGRPRKR